MIWLCPQLWTALVAPRLPASAQPCETRPASNMGRIHPLNLILSMDATCLQIMFIGNEVPLCSKMHHAAHQGSKKWTACAGNSPSLPAALGICSAPTGSHSNCGSGGLGHLCSPVPSKHGALSWRCWVCELQPTYLNVIKR